MDSVHLIYINGRLEYELLESIWYDTASPAQACIARLREIKEHIPNLKIVSFGQEFSISTQDDFVAWVKDIFSPTGMSYECDFSKYL